MPGCRSLRQKLPSGQAGSSGVGHLLLDGCDVRQLDLENLGCDRWGEFNVGMVERLWFFGLLGHPICKLNGRCCSRCFRCFQDRVCVSPWASGRVFWCREVRGF